MFNDYDTDVSGFVSCPESERLVNDRSSQTTGYKTSNQETQTSTTQSCSNQAAPENFLSSVQNPSYDPDRLLKFLNRVLPSLEEELKNFDKSSELSFNQSEIEFENEEQNKYNSANSQITIYPDFAKEKIISCLSWNSSDILLAVGCSEKDHSFWCSHESVVGLFNTGKSQFEKESPVKLLKVSSCVRCLEFHNYIPSLLGGGLYDGDVLVWDLKQDDEVLMIKKKNPEDEPAHIDAITSLKWREYDNFLWLISSGRDGRIIQWKISTTHSYEIHQRFLILKQHLPSTTTPNEKLEVLHMDFHPSKATFFVVACDGGNLFYCSLTTARPLTSFPQYKDPVLHGYKPRRGIITHVSCSNELFASCGTDSEIHIFKYEQETPVHKIHTNYSLYGVQWNSPKELISWGRPMVQCHKIQDSSVHSLIFETDEGVTVASFRIQSTTQRRKFAIGTERGELVILKDWILT